MSARTIYLSRLIGLYCLLVGLAMVMQKQVTIETVKAMIRDEPLMLFIGIVTVAAGLAVVLAHNVWRGGAAAVIVTLVGWTSLLKGALFLFLHMEARAEFYLRTLRYEQLFYCYLGFTLLLGIYLTYAGSNKA